MKQKIELKDFFYSASLNAYVAMQPLKISNRVIKAAFELGIKLYWDDEKRIKDITYWDAKKLLEKLNAFMLTPADYWRVYNEMLEKGDVEIVGQLQSDQSAEWLDVIFEKDDKGNVFMVERPKIIKINKAIKYEGEKKKIIVPNGRPGWFNPKNNIDLEIGLPIHVDLKREKGILSWSSISWKYWSVFKINEPVAAIRGYVTSSGTPSLDCDIPIKAKQPVLMLRECRKELLAEINPALMKTANGFVEKYILTTADRPAIKNLQEHELFYSERESFFDFLKESGRELFDSQDEEAQKVKEKFIDMLGIIRVIAKTKAAQSVIEKIDELAYNLFAIKKEEISFSLFCSFIHDSQEKLKEALAEKKRIVFVMGHKNPDTDAVVSCLIEAYRNNLLDKTIFYIPIVQGSRIPDETRKLLGDEISDSILFTDNLDYNIALNSGQARWILVDQNVSDVQRFVISIVDHHILSSKVKKQDISKTWEMVGSTTTLITQKFHGMGLDLDKDLARILYGAILMDTEGCSDKKMTYKDGLVMNDLKNISKIKDIERFYQGLMSYLLNTDDAGLLFNQDYKQDWGIFGFAIVKVKGVFSEKGTEIKKDLLNRLVDLAKKNNKDKNFPLTIVKVTDYLEDNKIINEERVYLIFNQYVLPEFKETMFEFLTKIIQNEFKNQNVQIRQTENSVDFWGVGDQLSRKVVAPFLKPIVEAFNEYYYSSSANLYVKREFLKINKQVCQAALKLGIELSTDREGRINNITYNEAKKLLNKLGLNMMSSLEYWKILEEVGESYDEQMLKHLRSAGFVEFLDTIILDGKYIIDHPKVIKIKGGYKYEGEKKETVILKGTPGLIYPEDINTETGLPKSVQDSRKYGDERLWRYWSPNAPVCIATRGHIFLLNQSSLDTKIHPDDALPNLGIRPCCYIVKSPVVEITESREGPIVKIRKIT